MRYPASEKLEIIRIVEQLHLPSKRTMDQIGIARRTFYRWYDRYLDAGPEALEDRAAAPGRVAGCNNSDWMGGDTERRVSPSCTHVASDLDKRIASKQMLSGAGAFIAQRYPSFH